jgi:GxxExxY protein
MERQDAKDAKREPREELDGWARGVIGAAIEVHRRLGPGFVERVYESAMVIELARRQLRVSRQVAVPIDYREQLIAEARLDLVVEGELVVELKAVDAVISLHRAQLLSYLRAGSFQLGLLINFNVPLLRDGIHRVLNPL